MVTYSKMFYNIETNNITTIDNELSITSPRSMSLYISICLLMPLWWGSWCRWPGNNRVGASSKNRTIPILAYHIPIISYSPNFPKNPTVNSLKKKSAGQDPSSLQFRGAKCPLFLRNVWLFETRFIQTTQVSLAEHMSGHCTSKHLNHVVRDYIRPVRVPRLFLTFL